MYLKAIVTASRPSVRLYAIFIVLLLKLHRLGIMSTYYYYFMWAELYNK